MIKLALIFVPDNAQCSRKLSNGVVNTEGPGPATLKVEQPSVRAAQLCRCSKKKICITRSAIRMRSRLVVATNVRRVIRTAAPAAVPSCSRVGCRKQRSLGRADRRAVTVFLYKRAAAPDEGRRTSVGQPSRVQAQWSAGWRLGGEPERGSESGDCGRRCQGPFGPIQGKSKAYVERVI